MINPNTLRNSRTKTGIGLFGNFDDYTPNYLFAVPSVRNSRIIATLGNLESPSVVSDPMVTLQRVSGAAPQSDNSGIFATNIKMFSGNSPINIYSHVDDKTGGGFSEAGRFQNWARNGANLAETYGLVAVAGAQAGATNQKYLVPIETQTNNQGTGSDGTFDAFNFYCGVVAGNAAAPSDVGFVLNPFCGNPFDVGYYVPAGVNPGPIRTVKYAGFRTDEVADYGMDVRVVQAQAAYRLAAGDKIAALYAGVDYSLLRTNTPFTTIYLGNISADLELHSGSGGAIKFMMNNVQYYQLRGSDGAWLFFASTGGIVGSIRSDTGGAVHTLKKLTGAAPNPGTSYGTLYFVDGTTAGTLKLVTRAGSAGAQTTILDNIPQT